MAFFCFMGGIYMCGIAGWIDFDRDIATEKNVLDQMIKTLKNRGPDAEGIYTERNVALIHRRLVVIDPENGKQPMQVQYAGKRYTLVYNGELYNTEELRQELVAQGHKFKGHSDTEVLLKSYLQWGQSCVEKLNGIFAFSIWDSKEQKLFMARDRIGVKPFFFYHYENGIIFGSEIKTLLKNPLVKPDVDENGLKEIFLLGPGRTPGQGIIKGIKELRPGEMAVFSRNQFVVKKYWELEAKEFTDDFDTAKEKTRDLLIDAIKRQLVSDVPLCCFLSGGLDSSIISKIAADHYKETGKEQLSTYSVDYVDNKKYFKKNLFQPNSDMEFIKIMVDSINSDHKYVVLDNSDLAEALCDATFARDLPGMADIDASLWLFCREMKKDFTVALSGECSDEIFGGYPWYHNKEILFDDTFPWSRSISVRKSILKEGLLKNCDEYVRERYLSTINATDKLSTDSKLNARMREMFMLNINWFMQTLLDRKDRMSMAHGLEVRVPFCDYRIVEYAFNMPWEIKAYKGREKGIVREAMSGILPDSIVYRKKSPYPKTFNPIYMKAVSERVKAILQDKNSPISEMLNHEFVMSIIDNPDSINYPWYGQLMVSAQILAYIVQLDCWFKQYNINII